MSLYKISEIIKYPLKSAAGIYGNESIIIERGLEYDRHWTLINNKNKVITARDYPQLLKLQPKITEKSLELFLENDLILEIPFETESQELEEFKVFSETTTGVDVNNEASKWFSNYLNVECRMVYMNEVSHRPVLPKYGGKENDVVSYADEAPILLLSEGSLEDLNNRLDTPITMKHFRPNIVVSGCQPYEEDQWKYIKIGDCEFEIIQLCKRCVFTTINPETQEKDQKQEPLRTLATYKPHPKGGVAFGVHMIPRKLGTISINDKLEVLE